VVATDAPTPAPAASGAAQADALTGQARVKYRSGDYKGALALFERAFAAEKRPALLYNMARTQEKLAAYQRAIELLKRYVSLFRDQNKGQDPTNLADVENLIRSLRQRGYTSLPKVSIESRPAGARVIRRSDGVTLGSTPLTIHMTPGSHKLTLELQRHAPMNVPVEVPLSGHTNFVFTLKTEQERAAISVWCNIRQVKIAIDGKVVAMTPLRGRIDVKPGRHQITLNREGYGAREDFVEVPQDKELHIRYVMQAQEGGLSWRSAVGWPVLAAGLGGVSAGVASLVQANGFYAGSLDFKYWEKWQNIGYGAGAAGVALGLGFVLWDAARDGTPEEDRVVGPAQVEGRELRPIAAPLRGKP
jgi:tetratricopeptide (TPR) repeat protein